jgi:hypothetical protein
MGSYTVSINKDLASFSFVNDTGENHDRWARNERNKWSHYVFLHKLINFMISRGWTIEHDKDTHKIIRSDYWYGRKGDLEFNLNRYPRGFSFEFYQNIVFENRSGGRYDFDKFEKMPYLIKLLYLNETRHMKEFIKSIVPGVIDVTDPEHKSAEDKIKAHFVKEWHHPQKSMDFDLSDLDGTTDQYHFNNTDRDGKTVYNGQIKYFRDWNGRLMRGKAYHNINNMWWVIVNSFEYRNMADFELFDPTREDFENRRVKKDRKPKEYILKREQISASKTQELINELKRRGVKVAV